MKWWMLGALGLTLVVGVGPAGAVPSEAPGVKSVTTVEPAEDPAYDSTGRRDPFRPPRVSTSTPNGEVRTPLQRYELGQLKLVAVIYDTNDPRAVVEDDEGLGYIVKLGTPIGPHGGEVHGIERGRLLVNEESVDYYGEHHPSEVVMELKASERGKR
ncbi:MAG: pilus assembly protein PilP [Acidimicrobiales bacterium]